MQKHSDIAEQYFLSGCSCAQSILCAFSDCTGLDHDTSMKLGSSLGGGFGRLREVCGAFSGACIVAGLLWGYTDETDKDAKAVHYALVQDIARRFREKTGSLICRELLEGIESGTSPTPSERTSEYYGKRPCQRFVVDAASVLDEIITERKFTKN